VLLRDLPIPPLQYGQLGSSLSIRCKVSPGIYNASVASGPIDVKYAELNTLRSTNRTPCSLATSIVALLYHLPWESCTFDELKSVARPCGVDNTTVAPVALAFTTMSVIISLNCASVVEFLELVSFIPNCNMNMSPGLRYFILPQTVRHP